jgi:hypothetical protein
MDQAGKGEVGRGFLASRPFVPRVAFYVQTREGTGTVIGPSPESPKSHRPIVPVAALYVQTRVGLGADFYHRSGIGSVIALWPADLPAQSAKFAH